MLVIEKKENIFYVPKEFVLAHCISSDCAMGKGLALEFVKKYPDMKPILKNINKEVGNSIKYIADDGTIIYNLITKEYFYNKPTYLTMRDCLVNLKKDMNIYNYCKLAIPHIGCGLDKLEWNIVLKIIQQVFRHEETTILICNYKKGE
jgi:hypothetical protein